MSILPALVLLTAGQVAGAESGPGLALVDSLAGEYRHVGGEADHARIMKAIDEVADSANWFIRGLMRSRLKESNTIAEEITIDRSGEKVQITYNGPTRTNKIGAPAVRIVAGSGDELDYTLSARGSRLIQRFEGERGGRINSFRLDGSMLIVRVTIFSKRLPQNVVYELRYRRKADPD